LAFKSFKLLDDSVSKGLDDRHKMNSPIEFYRRITSVQTQHNRLTPMDKRMMLAYTKRMDTPKTVCETAVHEL
jgi:hypothetical protein